MLAEGSGHLPLFSCVCVIQTHMHATLDAVMFFSDEYVYIYIWSCLGCGLLIFEFYTSHLLIAVAG